MWCCPAGEDKLQQVAQRCEGRASIEVLDVADKAAGERRGRADR